MEKCKKCGREIITETRTAGNGTKYTQVWDAGMFRATGMKVSHAGVCEGD